MRRRGGRRGFGSAIMGVVISLIMIGVVLAGLQLAGVTSMESALDTAREKALEYVECIPSGDCGAAKVVDDMRETISNETGSGGSQPESVELPSGGVDFDEVAVDKEVEGYRGPAEGEPYVNEAGLVNKDVAYSMLEELGTVTDEEDANKDVGYSRGEWKHWIGIEGRACWSIRSEVLYRDATPGTVKLVDRQRNITDDYDESCGIGTPIEEDGRTRLDTEDAGLWIGPYSGDEITTASSIDIDHIIPLSNAARNGGQEWDADRKELFANDLDNLLATSASENRSKGDKGPGEYMPPNEDYHCQYAKSYTSVAYKYDLTITESDYEVLNETITNCNY